jgi:hypothetical protein
MRTIGYILAAAVVLTALPTSAQQVVTTKPYCVDIGTLVNAQTMESSRSFSMDRTNGITGFTRLALLIELTDANTSITRFDVTCTESVDGNTTDYEPQECTVASGTATCVDSGVWQKASPGTAKWTYGVNLKLPDLECTFSVGTGAGAAADLLTVKGRLCAE